MEEFKSNSNKSKAENIEEKRIEPANIAPVKVRKASATKKFFGQLFAGDIKSVSSNVFIDVIIPTLKKGLQDIANRTIEWMLYGVNGNPNKPSSGPGTVTYKSYSTSYSSSTPRMPRPSLYTMDEVIFNNRGDAEDVLMRMEESLKRYHSVSVADFYDILNRPHNYTDNKYGWYDLSSCVIARSHDGYIIDFPKVQPLD